MPPELTNELIKVFYGDMLRNSAKNAKILPRKSDQIPLWSVFTMRAYDNGKENHENTKNWYFLGIRVWNTGSSWEKWDVWSPYPKVTCPRETGHTHDSLCSFIQSCVHSQHQPWGFGGQKKCLNVSEKGRCGCKLLFIPALTYLLLPFKCWPKWEPAPMPAIFG